MNSDFPSQFYERLSKSNIAREFPSSDDDDKTISSSSELAYSLFDDYCSSDADDVYKYMNRKYGFRYNILGEGSLNRIALVNYLNKIKHEKGNVMESYLSIMKNPRIILDNIEEHIKPPYYNDKLIWGFIDSGDESDDIILSNFIK